jgi:predicted nucleotidyltransferase
MISEEIKSKIAEIAKKHELDLVVLFGSTARETTHAGSDIDIAVLSKKAADVSLLTEEIGNVFQRNDVEVVNLSGASPFLMRAVAEDGVAIFESRKDFFTEWKVFARNVWFDSAWLRAKQKNALKSWARDYKLKSA